MRDVKTSPYPLHLEGKKGVITLLPYRYKEVREYDLYTIYRAEWKVGKEWHLILMEIPASNQSDYQILYKIKGKRSWTYYYSTPKNRTPFDHYGTVPYKLRGNIDKLFESKRRWEEDE